MSRLPEPLEGGTDEVLAVERASASVVAPVSGRRRRARAEAPAELPLAAVQDWFMTAITAPGSLERGLREARVRHGVSTGSVVTAGPTLDAADRMRIYHYGYRARLHECLADDFPGVRLAMGDARFVRLCDAVITGSPSRSPNLNRYGHALVAHLMAGPGRTFLADLARLEWALVEAVHAPPPVLLDRPRLQGLSAEQWVGARFVPSAALTVLSFDHPVNVWLQRTRDGERPPVPRRRPTATAVYRQGFVVWRMDLTPVTRGLLDRLCAGVPLGEALAPIEGQAGASQVMNWFTAWVSGGFFSAVEVG